jgi:hypothetical protein
MIVDVGRHARRSIFHFHALPDRLPMPPVPAAKGAIGFFVCTPRQTKVRWYFAPEGAKKLPMGTIFGSADFEDDFQRCESQYGEQPYAPQTYYNGKPPVGATGQKFCGTPDDFLKPKKWSPDLPTLLRGPTGLPLCCAPALRGAIVYTGATFTRRSIQFFQEFSVFNPPSGDLSGWLGGCSNIYDIEFNFFFPEQIGPLTVDIEIYARGGFSSSYDWGSQILDFTAIPGAGGGGAWVKKRMTLDQGEIYLIRFINDPTAGDYGDISFCSEDGSIVYALAKGGQPVTQSNGGGAGGLASACIGDVAFDGKHGGDSYHINSDGQWVSGGGGGGARPAGSGHPGQDGTDVLLGGYFPLPPYLTPPPQNADPEPDPPAIWAAGGNSPPSDGDSGATFPNALAFDGFSWVPFIVFNGLFPLPSGEDYNGQGNGYSAGASYCWPQTHRPSWLSGVSTAGFTIPSIGDTVTVFLLNTYINYGGWEDWLFLDGDPVTIGDGTSYIEGTISNLLPVYPEDVTQFDLLVTEDYGFAGGTMSASATIAYGLFGPDVSPATNGTIYGGGGRIKITPV